MNPPDRPPAVVAVCGHESADGAALRDVPGIAPVAGGREAYRLVRELLRGQERLCVVPMTLGRDHALVADAARALLALPAEERARVVLAEPFGTAEHLVGWLRAAANRLAPEAALLVTAPVGGPFEDAELYRIARLVRQYGRHSLVEVALGGGDPDPAEGVRRCRLLGAERVALLPAAFAAVEPPDPPEGAFPAGPLLAPAAIARVARARAADAWSRWRASGADGLGAALAAEHGHGYGHSHGPDEDRPHSHGPDEDRHHDHDHSHPHADGHGHRALADPVRRKSP